MKKKFNLFNVLKDLHLDMEDLRTIKEINDMGYSIEGGTYYVDQEGLDYLVQWSTNKFMGIPNVIILGEPQYPYSEYYILNRLGLTEEELIKLDRRHHFSYTWKKGVAYYTLEGYRIMKEYKEKGTAPSIAEKLEEALDYDIKRGIPAEIEKDKFKELFGLSSAEKEILGDSYIEEEVRPVIEVFASSFCYEAEVNYLLDKFNETGDVRYLESLKALV